MKVRTLFYLYGWRLRAHPFQELLAGAGIAAGVALLFAVQVANTSITGSVEQTLHGIVGDAQIQVTAGDDHGLDRATLSVIQDTPGVQVAAPVLERRAIVSGPRGSQPLQLFGVEPSLAALGGRLTRNFNEDGLSLPVRGIVLPDQVARAVGVAAEHDVTFIVAGHARRVRVAATLGRDQIGEAAKSPLALATLRYAQEVSGLVDRVSSVYVRARRGQEGSVRLALERLARGRLDVGSADGLARRLRVATAANDQSTALFSAISAIVGILFAFNAMLLTTPERRRFVSELRTQGATPAQVVAAIAFQALMLGVGASVVGLLVGDVLSRTVFHSVPGYLAFTFPIGGQRIVPFSAIAIAFGAGVVAALLAAGRPLADVFVRGDLESAYQEDGEPGEGIGARARIALFSVAVALFAATATVVALAPSTAVVGVVVLIVATLLAMPAVFTTSVWLVGGMATVLRLKLLMISAMSARSAMTRSIAVAAIAAVAVLGNVAIGGAREDLVQGVHGGFADHLRTADIWVTTAGRSLTTDSFQLDDGTLDRLRRTPGIEAVRVYRGGMLDAGSRRLWLIGRPRDDTPVVPPSQIIDGSSRLADARVRSGRWAAVSSTIANDLGLSIGDTLRLPTPSGGIGLRVAAILSNLGWGPGAVVLDADRYRRAWLTPDPTALEVDLAPGVSATVGKRLVTGALGAQGPALDVQTTHQLEAEFRGVLHEGLTRLNQISLLMLIASALALSAVMTAAVWERRRLLATYKLEGVRRRQLGGMLLLEALLVLGVGCALGSVVGVYGHLLGSRWLQLTTGYAAPFSVQVEQAVLTLISITLVSLAIVAVPGYLAARVPARLRFQE